MNPIVTAALGSILRWALALGAGWLVEHGIWSQSEATTYVAAAALALLSILWSLWAKYHARVKFLTALESPAHSTEAAVDAKIAIGIGAKVGPLILIVLLAGGSAVCALKDARHQAVVGSSVLYTAISAVDDAELALSQSGAITSAQHAQLNPKILTLLKAGKAANTAIAAWPQGTPAPAELRTAVEQLGVVALAVIDILPDGPAKAKLSTSLLIAQQAAASLLLIQGLIGGA